MSAESPPTGPTRTEIGRLSYRLPWRRTPAIRRQALVIVLVGATVLAGGLTLVWVDLGPVFNFVLPVLGLGLLSWGVSALATRSSAEVTPDRLILTEWVGPFPFHRERPLGHLRRIVPCRARANGWAEPPYDGVIEIVCEGSQSLWFAAGYSVNELAVLAADLSCQCGLLSVATPTELPAGMKVPTLFLGDRVRDEDTFERPDQPFGSMIQVDRRADGLTVLRLPPDTGSSLVPKFAVGGPLLFLFVIAFGSEPFPESLWAIMPAMLFVGALAYAIHIRQRWMVLAVSHDGLSVLTTGGLFPARQRHWPAATIKEIRRDTTSTQKSNDDQVCVLSVYTRAGKGIHLCHGRDDKELAWLATMLRRELGVPAVAREGNGVSPRGVVD